MKPQVLAALFMLCCSFAYGQTDTLQSFTDSVADQLEIKKLDSLQTSFTKSSDSLKQVYQEQLQPVLRWKQRYLSKADSIRAIQAINPLDTLNKPDASRYTKKIDSLDRIMTEMQQKTAARIDSLKGGVTAKLQKLKLPKQAIGKVSGLNASMDKVNISGFNNDLTQRLNLPDLKTDLPNTSLPQSLIPESLIPNPSIPNTSIPNTSLPNTSIPNTATPESLISKSSIPNTDKVKELTGQATDIQKQVTEATVSKEAMGKTLEDKAAGQVKGLPNQKLPDVAGMPGGVPATGDAAKEQLTQMAKTEATNHFSGKEEALMSAMDKMRTYKKKYSSVNSLAEIADGQQRNPIKEKSLRERLVPALTLQFQNWRDLMLDINPSMGYKINPHIVAGIGWNQRIAFNVPARAFNESAKVYGIRSYGEYMFKKGFGFRLDIETMNTPIKKRDLSDVMIKRDWVWSALVGIKQKYPIYKKLKGNAQLMYNLFDREHRSPYTDRLNWRIGIEFSFKKKKATDTQAKPIAK